MGTNKNKSIDIEKHSFTGAIWTDFKRVYFDKKTNEWKEEVISYMHDCSHWNLETHPNTKAIPNVRKKLEIVRIGEKPETNAHFNRVFGYEK